MADPLVVIYGSTGTGKSDLAVELATRFNGEIINVDAMQMYRGLPIITNQLTPEEQRGIPHYLLGNIGLDEEPWSVTSWKREATRIISDIRSRGKLPIVVGGTSYYLDGLLFDEKLVESDPATTEESETAAAKATRDELASQHPILRESAEVMLAKLQEVDPVMAERWHPKDIRKIRNSLEIYLSTGRRASDIYAEQRARKEAKRAEQPPSPWNLLLFWLYAKPDVLNERLDKRVDKMVANGLLDETSSVYDYLQRRLAAGDTVDRTKGIWQSIGFRQFESYLSAVKSTETDTPQAALEKLKQQGIEDTKTATRQYAKYQIRWIARKTIAALQEENLLSNFYLLDSSNISHWHSEVAEKGSSLLAKHLAHQPLPRPEDLSDTAREVLAEQLERSNRPETICNKTCEVCGKEFRIEEQWQKHLKSKKHQKAVKWARRQAEGWPTRGVAKGDKVEEGTDDDVDADDSDGQVPKP
ncbi:tRNA isopentenyltransferase [Neurospora crassa]|uniref:tRNA dimethylallyltransferase n=2 Tax=Neurospora crassa TaxID=5141 RepID=F5HCY3_NEUCR|nr:tRNA isopentenyltransferase [Neurospora crassa OR74A]EAA29598.2 tRNA isopentenyltransferase [Neurospora crassa OR74A]KHE81095.1 tRNA isopentenyltransferase [Neurospora crassa]CAD71227.1 related to tRNA isopentenyltransferase [Neurospora crassa]|eukprot:XP_958834.2 tRNA isopentenyltransferase [Neurospora crassa OR74A]